jgi:hypothetical protein
MDKMRTSAMRSAVSFFILLSPYEKYSKMNAGATKKLPPKV